MFNTWVHWRFIFNRRRDQLQVTEHVLKWLQYHILDRWTTDIYHSHWFSMERIIVYLTKIIPDSTASMDKPFGQSPLEKPPTSTSHTHYSQHGEFPLIQRRVVITGVENVWLGIWLGGKYLGEVVRMGNCPGKLSKGNSLELRWFCQ